MCYPDCCLDLLHWDSFTWTSSTSWHYLFWDRKYVLYIIIPPAPGIWAFQKHLPYDALQNLRVMWGVLLLLLFLFFCFLAPLYLRVHFPCCLRVLGFDTDRALALGINTSQTTALCWLSEMPQLKKGSPCGKCSQNLLTNYCEVIETMVFLFLLNQVLLDSRQ